ncbi:MAG: helix-turn-helix domain-containing protein [Candidatus Gastranaerophilales bacterium]|nr:helix-turn-helix domain-containing protein [Candidatus Gastranaerophilales bacterium]
MNEFLFNHKSPKDIAEVLVEKIKQHRKLLKISQEQLAAKSGVSLGSIKRFESKYEISLNSLIKILIALNLEKDFENLFTHKTYNSIDEVING